jgi:galactose mutarotase-like enzyme
MALLLKHDAGAEARILPARGGLLTDLALRVGGRRIDVLWTPDDLAEDGSGWPGGGLPVLFPFAGRVFHEGRPFQYELGGQVRSMPLHGFAYALPWEVVSESPAAATLRTSAGARTAELYPFDFALTARYELARADALTVTLTVESRGLLPGVDAAGLEAAMPVALGVHPYFCMPLPGGDRERCRLVTSARQSIAVTNAGGAGKAAPLARAPGGLPLSTPLLASLILSQHAEPAASLVDDTAGVAVTVRWSPAAEMPYVVLWTRAGEPFHCVEPWMGLPDAVSTGAGVRWLDPGQSLTVQVEITAHAT